MKHEALIELVKNYGRSMGCAYTAQYRGETDLGEHFEREAAATLEHISDELAKRQVRGAARDR